MRNWRGTFRDGWGTLRSIFELSHLHLIRMRMQGNQAFYRYAKPVFQHYIQSLNSAVKMISYVEALRLLGIDHERVTYSIPYLEGYIGLSDWERVALATIARHYAHYPMFEIGTAAGSTAILLAYNSKQLVFTLDLPSDGDDNVFALPRLRTDDQVIAGRQRASLLCKFHQDNIIELTGDSAAFDFRPYHGRIGLFFIDGAHSFEYVQSDTFRACQCCNEDGIILWDDFGGSRDVSRFLNGLAQKGSAIYAITGTKLAFSTDITGCFKALL